MPALVGQVTHAQIIVYGQIAASGSNAVNTVNVFNYRRTGVVIGPSKVDLDTMFQSTVVAPLLAALNVRWGQLRNSIRWLNDAEDLPFEISHPNNGSVAGDSMTGNEIVSLRLRTAKRGRSYRGSCHLGPLSEADSTTGASDVLNAAAIVRFQAVVTGLATTLNTADGNSWKLQVFSRLLSQALTNPTNIVANDVVQVSLNQRISDMARRRVKSIY